MDRLTQIIAQSDFDVPQEVTLREHTLKILYRVYQKQPILHLKPLMEKHRASLQQALKDKPERAESLNREIKAA